jgi:cytoskeletal protein RodZ
VKIKVLKISIIFLALVLVLGGFFYFKGKNKPLVYENKSLAEDSAEKNVDVSSEKNIPVNEEKASAEPDIEEKIQTVPEKINPEVPNDVKKTKENSTGGLKIADNLVTWGFSKAKEREINTIVVHSSYNALGGDKYDLDKLIAEYKEYGVAPHYVIDREGSVYRLVKDNDVAYHAGESKTPDGKIGVNNFSLGIELMNTEDDKYTADQYKMLNNLIGLLKDKYEIKYVLGHNQIAPGRKTDPWNINWEKVDK